MMPDNARLLEYENERLRFQVQAWQFTTYCFLGSTLSFLACALIGGFHA